MMRKVFATSCLVGLIIVGSAALACAAPNAKGSGPFISNSTTSTTSTTSATNAPRPPEAPAHTGY
jgi:hypothetical protein